MSKLSRFVKKNKKKLATIGRVALAGLTHGKSEKIIGAAKSIGVAVKTYRGLSKQPTKAETAHAAKIGQVSRPKIVGISEVQATTMPGGKKLKGVPTLGSAPRPKAAVVKTRKKAAAKAKAPKRSSGGRKPPKGGLDLKGLSASWKAAGKPGTWQAWIASHK